MLNLNEKPERLREGVRNVLLSSDLMSQVR
jgi:hypothetical protein